MELPKYFRKSDGRDITRIRCFIGTLWAIWLHRNNVVFRSADVSPNIVMSNIFLLLAEEEEKYDFSGSNSVKDKSINPTSNCLFVRLGSCQGEICNIWVDEKKSKFPEAGIG